MRCGVVLERESTDSVLDHMPKSWGAALSCHNNALGMRVETRDITIAKLFRMTIFLVSQRGVLVTGHRSKVVGICLRTSPSSGQATPSPQLRRLKLLACHSRAAYTLAAGSRHRRGSCARQR
jgi:hypothetical protein